MSLKSLKGKASRLKERLRSFLRREAVLRRSADFFCEASVLAFVLGILEMVVANFNAAQKMTVRQFCAVFAVSSVAGAAFFIIGCTIEGRLPGKPNDTE
jgi:hypothetical protein